MSTLSCFAMPALRSLVSISAIGSCVIDNSPLPAGFLYARNLTAMSQSPETMPAQAEFSHVGARPATNIASIDSPRGVFRLFMHLAKFGLARQGNSPLLSERHTQCFQQV